MSSNTAQAITPALRNWIVEQAQAGHKPEAVLAAMRSSGWEESIAIRALEETLQTHLTEHAQANGLPEPKLVPGPDLSGSKPVLLADGHEVKVLTVLQHPRVIVFGGLLSDAECDEIMALADKRLSRSETVATSSDGSEVNAARTSDGMFFERGEHPVIAKLESRIAELLDWPVQNGEGLQILSYRPGAEYQPHYDYFEPEHVSTPSILKRGGQRVGTIVMYLNTPEAGGATTFPDIKFEVSPVRGNAVFFSYDRPHPMTMTLHGGAPVIAGQKWVATKWLREGKFE